MTACTGRRAAREMRPMIASSFFDLDNFFILFLL
jgi:hypothetical protein